MFQDCYEPLNFLMIDMNLEIFSISKRQVKELNKVILTGNLAKDVEVRYTQSGKAVTRMTVAVNQGYGDKKTTDFFNLVAWDKTAEHCGKYLSKGSKVLVEGTLKNNNYEDKNGVKRYDVEVIVGSIEFIGSKKKAASTGYDGEDVSDDDMPF